MAAFNKIHYERNISVFFDDDIRRVDFIIRCNEIKTDDVNYEFKIRMKKAFEEELINRGLNLEYTKDSRNTRSESIKEPCNDQTTPNDVDINMDAYHNIINNDDNNDDDDVDNRSCFIKVHANDKALLDGAELLKMHKRLKDDKSILIGKNKKKLIKLPSFTGFPPLPKWHSENVDDDYFTAPFSREYINAFDLNMNKVSDFFKNSERSLIAYTILSTVEYVADERFIGIRELIKLKIYSNFYPLHESLNKKSANQPPPKTNIPDSGDGDDDDDATNKKAEFDDNIMKKNENETTATNQNDRYKLRHTWACWRGIFTYQPLDLIRDYFGEKIAIYFTWLGFYTSMLMPVSLIGLLCFIYGLLTYSHQQPVKDICNKTGPIGSLIMCPNCDKQCTFTRLSKSCLYSKISYVFDNNFTVFFAFLMAMWSTIFLELWKRKEKRIQYDWDVFNFEDEEQTRPEFLDKKAKFYKGKKGDEFHPFIPWYVKAPRKCLSIATVLFMISLVLSAIFGVIVYRIIIISVFYSFNNTSIKENAKIMTSVSSALLNLLVIQFLSFIYQRLALKLTYLEIPRTTTKFEDSFSLKMFLFQFINYYGSIFYIAFFKGRFTNRPGDVNTYFLGKWRQDECDPSGCFVDLFIQLGIIMVGKQTFNNFKEMAIPLLKKLFLRLRHRYKKRGRGGGGNGGHDNCGDDEEDDNNDNDNDDNNLDVKYAHTRWETDNLLPDPPASLFDEYLEMVIQFGFVTIFVSAFPLAPVFALINNLFEIRLDAIKFLCLWKRPVAFKCHNIGVWYSILKKLTIVAILSNAFIIAFTTEFVPKAVYIYTYNYYNNNNNNNDNNENDNNLVGFMESKLAVFNVSHYNLSRTGPDADKWTVDGDAEAAKNLTVCWFPGYYVYSESKADYVRTDMYWLVMLARVSLVVIFEHCIFVMTWLISVLIPDVPADVKRSKILERELWHRIIGYNNRKVNLIENLKAGMDMGVLEEVGRAEKVEEAEEVNV